MIEVDRLFLRQGVFELREVSFRIATGDYAVLMGKTGSGKTSLLEAICGLRPISSGRICIDGRDVTRLRPAQRQIGFVPQDGALFSTMTVAQQIAFPLRIRRWPAERQRARVTELSELLEIRHLLDRRPTGLSGGETQRVALGRALSFYPKVILLDEPLSALDDDTRLQMYDVLQRAQSHAHVTALHITHSRQEAAHLATDLLRIDEGRVSREDVPASTI